MIVKHSITEHSYYPWTCWLLAAIAYFIQYGLLVFPSAITYELQNSLNISYVKLGIYSAVFLYAFVFMQVPVGLMFDRYGSKNLLFCSTLLVSVGCFVLSVSNIYEIALIGRLMMGIGGSFTFIGAIYLARTWFPIAVFPIVVGLTESLSGLGEIGLPSLFAALKNLLGWQMVLLEIGVLTLMLAFLMKIPCAIKKV